jgi:predicted permease
MRWIYKLPLRLRSLFRRSRVEHDLSDELRFHLENLAKEKIAQGTTPDEARYAALRELGGVEQIKEECRDMRRVTYIENFLQDVRYGLRQFRRSPGFTTVAVLTLALGLASVITIFAVVDTVVLRPLDFPHSERLFTISENVAPLARGPMVATIGEFQQWEKSGLFVNATAIEPTDYTLLGRARARQLSGVRVTPDFFRVFEVRPFLGRGFIAQDATPGHDKVIVLSYPLWKSAFGGNPHIVGKAVQMSNAMVTVIGVVPPRFDFPRLADVRTIMSWAPEEPEFWTPLVVTQKMVESGNFNYLVVGRLKDKVTRERAAAEFKASAVQLFRGIVAKEPAYREVLQQILATFAVYVTPLRDTMSSGIRSELWILLAAVGLLLLLVLFNLGNLLLTRNVNRLREFAVREALGAKRWQIFRQGFVEQIVLITASAGAGLVLAEWGVTAIRTIGAARLPRLYDLSIDARVVGLLVVLCLITAIVFGSLPLLLRRKFALSAALHSEGRSTTVDRRTNRLKSGLMVLEIAVSLVLLIGAGLLIRSMVNVMRVNPGFDPHNLLTLQVSLNPKNNQNAKQQLEHTRQLLSAFRRIPGVRSAAVVSIPPLTGEANIHSVSPVGKSISGTLKAEGAEYRVVDPSYFNTMRIPLLAGRDFRDGEAGGVAVINQEMAVHFWPRQSAVGKQFRDGDNPPLTVIGVIGDIHSVSLEQHPRMQFYVPLASEPYYSGSFMVRTRINPDAILPLAENAVWRLDPEAPLSHAQTMERLLQATTLDRRFETSLISGFAAAALFLAALGLFSIASLSVARRTREFGIRLALGARSGDLVMLELSQTLKLAIVGLALGLAVSLALGKVLAGFLFNVTAWNPEVYGLAVLALLAPLFLAAWFPARRAARVDPASTLRYD